MMQRSFALSALLLFAGCTNMRFDLADVPFAVSATPGAAGGELFELQSKYVLYVHGLLGEKQPSVAALLREHCAGCREVTDFRVSSYSSLWDWLGTHLSLGFVRLKTVTISGRRMPGEQGAGR